MKPIRCALISAGCGLGLWLFLTSLLISNPPIRFGNLAEVDQTIFLLVYRTLPWLLMIGGPIVCWVIHAAQNNPEKKYILHAVYGVLVITVLVRIDAKHGRITGRTLLNSWSGSKQRLALA